MVLAKLRHHNLDTRVHLTRGLLLLIREIRIKDFFKQERANKSGSRGFLWSAVWKLGSMMPLLVLVMTEIIHREEVAFGYFDCIG
jgi:hypothetical protein